MTTNYASILANRYHKHKDTSMQGEVELAFTVVDILSDVPDPTKPWSKLLVDARGLIKTRARRSKTRFRMQFKRAVDSSDLSESVELPGLDLPKDREDRFRLRVLNPRFLSRNNTLATATPKIVTTQEPAIITQEKLFTKEREDEFERRVSDPRSFRRGD